MPKLPIIIAEGDIPKTVPYGKADPAVYAQPYTQAAASAREFQHTAQSWFHESMAVLKEKKEAQDLTDAMRMQTQLMDSVFLKDQELKKNYDHETHADRLRDESMKIADQIRQTARNPQVADRFAREAMRIVGEKTITARTEAVAHVKAGANRTNMALMQSTLQMAGNSDPIFAAEHVKFYEDKTNELIAKGQLDAVVGQQRIQTLKKEVDMALALKDAYSDVEGGSLLKAATRVENGHWKNIDPDTSQRMAKNLREMDTAEKLRRAGAEDRLERKEKERHQRVFEQEYSNILAKAYAGTLTPTELEAFRVRWRANQDPKDFEYHHAYIKGEYDHLMKVMTDPKKETPSNPEIRAQLLPRVYAAHPTITEKELRQYFIQHQQSGNGIDSRDFVEWSKHVTATNNHMDAESRSERREEDSKRRYRHSMAIARMEAGLAFTGTLGEKAAAKVGEQKEFIYRQMSIRVLNGKEDPDKVMDEILPPAMRAVWGDIGMDRDKVLGHLNIPKDATPKDLLARREEFARDPRRNAPRGSPEYQQWAAEAAKWAEYDKTQEQIRTIEDRTKMEEAKRGGRKSGGGSRIDRDSP